MHFFPTVSVQTSQAGQLGVLFDIGTERPDQDFSTVLSEHVSPEQRRDDRKSDSPSHEKSRAQIDNAVENSSSGESQLNKTAGSSGGGNAGKDAAVSESEEAALSQHSEFIDNSEPNALHSQPAEAGFEGDSDDWIKSESDPAGEAWLLLASGDIHAIRSALTDKLVHQLQLMKKKLQQFSSDRGMTDLAGMVDHVNIVQKHVSSMLDISASKSIALSALKNELIQLNQRLQAIQTSSKTGEAPSEVMKAVCSTHDQLKNLLSLLARRMEGDLSPQENAVSPVRISGKNYQSKDNFAVDEQPRSDRHQARKELTVRLPVQSNDARITPTQLPLKDGVETAAVREAAVHKQSPAPLENVEQATGASRRSQILPQVQVKENGTLITALDGDASLQKSVFFKPGGDVKAEPSGDLFFAGEKQSDARQGFFRSPGREKVGAVKPSPSSIGKLTEEIDFMVNSHGQQPQSTRTNAMSAGQSKSMDVHQQVESGIFRNLGQGTRQLVLRLDPVDLGQVSVILQVRGKEVHAVMRTTTQEASLALGEQLSQLRAQLEAQGLKVGRLEVQTELADSQSQAHWQGSEQHNRYQENRELAMSAQRWRTLGRIEPGVVQDVQNALLREKNSRDGLDIFA